MSDLRHQVAEALYLAFWDADPKVPTEVAVWMAATKGMDSGKPIDEAWLSVADECLRQMEWARTHCQQTGGEPLLGHFSGQGEQQYRSVFVPVLTLAPPDWKAE